MQLSALLDRTGLDVLDHLEREALVAVVDGLQAQGDLLVVPHAVVPYVSATERWHPWQDVPAAGAELVRGDAGNNPHILVADPGTCRYVRGPHDPLRLAVALLENTAPVWLLHPEHGGTGIAPGRWVVRRQREEGATAAGRWSTPMLVCD